MLSSRRTFAQLMVTTKTTCKISLRPESKTSYSARYQTHNSSTLQLGGGRTQDHSLVICSPYTIQWIVQDSCKRDVVNSPLQILVLCSTTFSAIFLNKGWQPMYKEQRPSNSCLLITHHDILEAMFQHMVTELVHLIKRNRSRKIEASIRPVVLRVCLHLKWHFTCYL